MIFVRLMRFFNISLLNILYGSTWNIIILLRTSVLLYYSYFFVVARKCSIYDMVNISALKHFERWTEIMILKINKFFGVKYSNNTCTIVCYLLHTFDFGRRRTIQKLLLFQQYEWTYFSVYKQRELGLTFRIRIQFIRQYTYQKVKTIP